MIRVTGRLTAKNRDQLRNSTLGNRVWATFTFYTCNTGVSKVATNYSDNRLVSKEKVRIISGDV